MPNKKETPFDHLVEGMEDAIAYAESGKTRGRKHVVMVPVPDVKAIRKQTKLSQTRFADEFGFSVGTLRDWEQGKRNPDTAARAYLAVIQHDHRHVRNVLSQILGSDKPAEEKPRRRRSRKAA